MRVLVTGANGFIGRPVCARLVQAGHFVYALGRSKESAVPCNMYISCDLGYPEQLGAALRDKQIDTCIHLAWTGLPDFSYENCWISMRNSFQLLETGCKAGIKHFIFAGSCFEYLNPSGAVPETWPTKNSDAYTAAKSGVLGLARQYCIERQICFHWLRFFYVIGPGQNANSLIPYVVRSFRDGKLPVLRTAYNENDFIDVRDIAGAVLAVLEKNPTGAEIFNVGTGYATPIWKLVSDISYALRRSETLRFEDHSPKISFCADISQIHSLTGWEPQIKLSQSINHYFEFSAL